MKTLAGRLNEYCLLFNCFIDIISKYPTISDIHYKFDGNFILYKNQNIYTLQYISDKHFLHITTAFQENAYSSNSVKFSTTNDNLVVRYYKIDKVKDYSKLSIVRSYDTIETIDLNSEEAEFQFSTVYNLPAFSDIKECCEAVSVIDNYSNINELVFANDVVDISDVLTNVEYHKTELERTLHERLLET